jgi:hypothetical protein
MKSFLSRFGSLVLFVLSGFDRLRLAGESRLLNHARGVESYLWQRQILFKDFPKHAEELTTLLRDGTEALAQQQGVPLRYLNSPNIDKEAQALALASQPTASQPTASQPPGEPARLGRIAVLTCLESCTTYHLRKNDRGQIEPRKEPGRCLHYYHYFQHERLGLCYVRIQSWFPFSVRVGLNGRHWLYRQLQQRGLDFQRQGNLLLRVQDPAQAQALLDEQRHVDWPTLLHELVEPIHPLWSYLHDTAATPYYWMIEQSEWATDFVFREAADLARWYPRWIRHGIDTLSCKDVLRYLGKKLPDRGYGNCSHEAKIDLRTRAEGTRLKFWYDTNSLKIYDKEAQALRIETTLNNPKGFKVFRTKEGEADDAPKSWQHLRKGVADASRRAEVSHAANNRLADSLAAVADNTSLGQLLEPMCQPVVAKNGRRVRALNPAAGPDGELLRCLAQGDFLINGFRNRDLRSALCVTTTVASERRRQAARISRLLALLQAHGLIVKVLKTHRYRLSALGKRITTALLTAYQADVDRLAKAG